VLELLRDRRVRVTALVIIAAALQSTVWTLTMGAFNVGNELAEPLSLGERVDLVAPDLPLWVLQSIAGFPIRNEATQPFVYPCYLIIFGFVLGWALKQARGLTRVGILSTCVAALLVPFLVAVSTFNSHAGVWQGRYGLPFSLGIIVLAGHVLDREGRAIDPRARIVGLALFVAAQATGPGDVMRKALHRPVDLATSWMHPPLAVVVLLAGVGAGILWWASTAPRTEDAAGH
jgi:hypothetical protein